MRKIKLKRDMYSVFSYMVAILVVFMFRNQDSYFNINNYRNGLIIVIIFGCLILFLNLINNGFTITPLKVFIFLSCCSMVISKYILDKQAEPYYILFIIFLLLFLLCLGEVNFNIINVRFLINSYILSSIVMSMVILIQHRTPYVEYGILRLALYYNSTDYYDVNFTAMFLLLPTLLAFYGALKGKKENRPWYMFATVVNMITILMLGSRGTFAPVVAIMVLLILMDKKVSFTKILIVMVMLFAVFFLLPEDIFTRLIGSRYIGSEHKRYVDWAYGLKVFSNSPIWGNGMRGPKVLVNEVGGGVMNYTIHNTYIVYLAQLGIVGSIPFFGILIYPIIIMLKKYRNIYFFLSYCGILFSCLMIEANYSYVLFVPLAIIYMILNFVSANEICGKDILRCLFDGDVVYEKT